MADSPEATLTPQKIEAYRNNIRYLYIIRALHFSFVIIPTYALFIQSHSLGIEDVLTLKAILSVVVLLLEVPSGFIADLFGRRMTLIIGALFWLLSALSYCFIDTFFQFAVAEILFGIALSLLSGADTAIFYDTLAELDEAETFGKHESRLTALAGFSEACGGLLGAFIASYDLRSPFYLYAVFVLFIVFYSFKLVEPEGHYAGVDPKEKTRMKAILKFVFIENRALFWLTIHSAIAAVATFLIVWLSQDYMKLIDFPVAAFGVAWAAFHAIMGVSSLYADALSRRYGVVKVLMWLSFLIIVAYICLGIFQNVFALAFVGLLYVNRGIRTPITKSCIHNFVSSEMRATVFSLHGLVFRVIWIIYAFGIGLCVKYASLSTGLVVTGVVLGFLALFTLSLFSKASEQYDSHGSLEVRNGT